MKGDIGLLPRTAAEIAYQLRLVGPGRHNLEGICRSRPLGQCPNPRQRRADMRRQRRVADTVDAVVDLRPGQGPTVDRSADDASAFQDLDIHPQLPVSDIGPGGGDGRDGGNGDHLDSR